MNPTDQSVKRDVQIQAALLLVVVVVLLFMFYRARHKHVPPATKAAHAALLAEPVLRISGSVRVSA